MSGELFDHVLIIQLEVQEGKLKPRVGYQFPPAAEGDGGGAEETGTIVQFCFPEEAIPKATTRMRLGRRVASETFSFALTATDGSKRYGYCRRWVEGSAGAECCCVISLVPSLALFTQLLDIVEERRKVSPTAVFSFLKTVLAHPFPDPGDSIVVRTFGASSASGGPDEYTLTRPATETLADFVSLEAALFRRMSVADVVELWQALLCERRVLVAAGDLETLSQAVTALCALLHPFSWQHVFIPILPKSLVGYVTAPMPFLIGCLHSSIAAIKDMGMPLEEIYLADLDAGTIIMRPTGVPRDLLPREPSAALRNSLVAALSSGTLQSDRDPAISRSFLRFFQTILGDYSRFFSKDKALARNRRSAKPVYFDTQAFLKAAGSANAEFLSAFQGSQLWFMFVASREDMAARNELRDRCPILAPLTHAVPSRLGSDLGVAEGSVCAACLSRIKEKDLCSSHAGKLYHTKCFVCGQCGALLEGERKVGEKDGKPHCGKCDGSAEEDYLDGSEDTPARSLKSMWGAMKKKLFRDGGSDAAAAAAVASSSTSSSEASSATAPPGEKKEKPVSYFQFSAHSLRRNIASGIATLRSRRHKDKGGGGGGGDQPSDASMSSEDLSPPPSPDPNAAAAADAPRRSPSLSHDDLSSSPHTTTRSFKLHQASRAPAVPPAVPDKRPAQRTEQRAPAARSQLHQQEQRREHHRSLSDPDHIAAALDVSSESVSRKRGMFESAEAQQTPPPSSSRSKGTTPAAAPPQLGARSAGGSFEGVRPQGSSCQLHAHPPQQQTSAPKLQTTAGSLRERAREHSDPAVPLALPRMASASGMQHQQQTRAVQALVTPRKPLQPPPPPSSSSSSSAHKHATSTSGGVSQQQQQQSQPSPLKTVAPPPPPSKRPVASTPMSSSPPTATATPRGGRPLPMPPPQPPRS